ncbi:hypothetical protein K7432_003793 [Basidiobolus ranarum]|uniref:Terpene synthase n=1 Tax=Basidiobolus ranarum TaxID=34480 RepID=A0ABR2WZ95_9FUNG
MKIHVKDIECSFPSLIHEKFSKVEEATNDWLLEFNLIQSRSALERVNRSKLGRLPCRIHPRTPFKFVFWATKLYTWLFMFDDQFDDGPLGKKMTKMYPIFVALLKILGTDAANEAITEFTKKMRGHFEKENNAIGEKAMLKRVRRRSSAWNIAAKFVDLVSCKSNIPVDYSLWEDPLAMYADQIQRVLTSPICLSLAELWRDYCRFTDPDLQERTSFYFARYLRSYFMECEMRKAKGFPDVETYIRNRQDAGGMLLSLEVIEFTEQAPIPKEIYQSADFQKLRVQIINIVCWTNDLFSFEKEYAHGDINNLVIVLQNSLQCPFQEAADKANDMLAAEIRAFVETQDALQAWAKEKFDKEVSESLGRHVFIYQNWIKGHIDWCFESLRYHQVPDVDQYLENIFTCNAKSDMRRKKNAIVNQTIQI